MATDELMRLAAAVERHTAADGYESPSQFSREYRRLFGAPPRRDVAALQVESRPTGEPRSRRRNAVSVS